MPLAAACFHSGGLSVAPAARATPALGASTLASAGRAPANRAAAPRPPPISADRRVTIRPPPIDPSSFRRADQNRSSGDTWLPARSSPGLGRTSDANRFVPGWGEIVPLFAR